MRFPTVVRQRIHRPLVVLHVHSAGRSTMTDALIDTGADISIFPKFVADRLRLNLTGLPEVAVNALWVAAGSTVCAKSIWNCVALKKSCGGEHLSASAEHDLSYAFLGTKGFFEFFDLA